MIFFMIDHDRDRDHDHQHYMARIKKHERIKAGFFYIYFICGNSKNNKNFVKKITYKQLKYFFIKKIISLPSKYIGIYFEKLK